MKRVLFALFCALFLFGCLSSERLLVSQSSGATTGAATKAITGTTDPGVSISEDQSKSFWAAATPLSIIAWKYSGSSLELIIQNKDAQKISVDEIQMDGESVYSTKITVTPSETKTITIELGSSCGNSGDSFDLSDISIIYSKGGMDGFTQKGPKPIVGTCS